MLFAMTAFACGHTVHSGTVIFVPSSAVLDSLSFVKVVRKLEKI